MKILKKIVAGILAVAMIAALGPTGAVTVRAESASGNPLRLWYDEPASRGQNIIGAGSGYSDWDGSNTWQQQTLPIGNGDMGANVLWMAVDRDYYMRRLNAMIDGVKDL